MKILTISPIYDPKRGLGVSKVIKSVNENLALRGHQCTVLTINGYSAKNVEEIINAVEIKRVSSPWAKRLYGISWGLYNYINTDGTSLLKSVDVVHIHMYHSLLSLESIYLLRSCGKPIIFTPYYHGTGHTPLKSLLHELYKRPANRMFNNVDKVICNSDYEAKILREHFALSHADIGVIPLGIDFQEITSYIKKANSRRKISLLFVGRLVEHKGVQYILEAMHHIKENYQVQPILDIVGSGPYKIQLEKVARVRGLEKDLVWSGFVPLEELWRKYKEADVFLLLSRLESYGLVVAEALASGTPSIVADTSALSEFIGETGCFGVDYPPDPKNLADLILTIHKSDIQVGPFDPNKIRTWDKVADEYQELYRESCNR